MLNSLLGRFGLYIYKSVTKLCNMDIYNKLEATTTFTSIPKRIHDSILISYIPEINQKICKSLNIDTVKAAKALSNVLSEGEGKTFTSVSILSQQQ